MTVPMSIIVDDAPYPFDLAAVTASQVVAMRRDLAVNTNSLVEDLIAGVAEIPEVVALMAISLQQQGLPCDVAALADQVTLGSDVGFSFEVDDTAT